MFGLGKSTDFSRAGIGFNIGKDGFGLTAYNDTGAKLALGDVVALIFTGTSGQELKAIIPVTNTIQGYIGVVCDTEGIEYQSIGKVQIYGKCQARTLGHASLAVNTYLEVMNRIAFDGTSTTLEFVPGSGTTKDTIEDSDSGFVTDGFLAGMRIAVTGSTTAGNDGSYEIYSVAAGVLTLTGIGELSKNEDGSAASAILTHGYLEYTGTADAAETFAVAREAYTTTTTAALKWVQLTGLPKVIAAS